MFKKRMAEYLVFIAMFAVAVAMLLPVLSKAKEVSTQELCANNLKQLGQAFKAYAQDYNGYLPAYHDGVKGGFQAITPYVQNAPKTAGAMFGRDYLRCPTNETGTNPTYGMNYPVVFGYTDPKIGEQGAAKLSKIPGSVYLVADGRDLPIYYPYSSWELKTDSDGDGINDSGPGGKYNGLNPVHNGTANCLFADGHVEAVALKDWLANKNGIWGETDYAVYR